MRKCAYGTYLNVCVSCRVCGLQLQESCKAAELQLRSVQRTKDESAAALKQLSNELQLALAVCQRPLRPRPIHVIVRALTMLLLLGQGGCGA